jgi:Tol biopolymer transport system component
LYIKNIETGELILVDTSLEGDTGNGETCGSDGYWSPDSTRVAFDSASSNLVTGDTNASCDVFVKNLLSGEIERVSLDAAGGQIMDPSYIQNSVSYTNRNFWSEGGDYVRFLTPAGLLDSDSDNDYDWYGKSLSDGSLTLNPEGFISDAGGPRPWSSFDPSGSLLAYVGDALKLYVEESGVPRLIAENVHPNDVSWTPDGSRIVIAMPSGIGVFFP